MSNTVCFSNATCYEVLEVNRQKSERLELLKRVIYDTPGSKREFADFFVKVATNTRTYGDWIVKVFLEDNMNINIVNKNGNAPLYYVVSSTNSHGTERTLRMLLEHGADVNGCCGKFSYLTDAIFFAYINPRCHSVRNQYCMLLEAGADVEKGLSAFLTWRDLCHFKREVGIEFTWILDMLIEAI